MKKNRFKAAFFLAFCLFFSAFSFSEDSGKIPNQKNLNGKDLSDDVYKTLSANGFSPFYQELSPTGRDEFAKNVYVEFFPEKQAESADGEKTIAVLDFRQEDFYLKKQEFLSFLNDINSANLKCKVEVLFSAQTKPSVPPLSRISGSEVFAESTAFPDECFALTVDFDAQGKNSILTGCFSSTAPLWLCKKITDSFYNLKEKYSFENFISSLYRLGFIHGEARMEAFSKNEIPAVHVSFSSSETGKGFLILKNFLESYTENGTQKWDQHYVFVPLPLPAKPVVMSETVCLGICMALAVLALFSLCAVSFTGKQGEQNKYDLIKNLYMIPLTLAVSLLGLSVSQIILRKITGNFISNPVMFFGLKIIISMAFISFFYALHNILRLPTDIFIYSYIIQFIAIFNIFFFSLRDLMLFVPFTLEYIFVFIFRKRKGLANLIILFILMMFPFIPYAVDILQKTKQEDFSFLLLTGFWGNFSVALALFPFQIVWLKILVRLNIYNKQKKYSALKLLRNGLVSTAAVLAFCFAFMQAVYVLVYKPVKTAEEYSKILIKNDFSNLCSVKITKNEFSGMNTNHIRILSEKDALRYEVKLTSLDNKVAIYDSVYAYDFVSEPFDEGKAAEEAEFVIPDFPPREITIDYAANPDSYAAVEVTAFYPSDKKNIILREKTNTFVGVKN